jgi:hypothetical protein
VYCGTTLARVSDKDQLDTGSHLCVDSAQQEGICISVDPEETPRPGETIPAPQHSEDHLAEEIVSQRGNHWRYVAAWGQWFHWTGTHWKVDETQRCCQTNSNQSSLIGLHL